VVLFLVARSYGGRGSKGITSWYGATSRSLPLSPCATFGAVLGCESNSLSTMQSVMKYDRFFE
jgi:hypothetical protein